MIVPIFFHVGRMIALMHIEVIIANLMDMHGTAQRPCTEVSFWLGIHVYTAHLGDPFGVAKELTLDAKHICDRDVTSIQQAPYVL